MEAGSVNHSAGSLKRMVRQRPDDVYVTEKIEAYNVAIAALRNHEPADGDSTGLARRLRRALAHKLDNEIQRWCNQLPSNGKLSHAGTTTHENQKAEWQT